MENTSKWSELLKGAYDIHIHCAPDIPPRSQDLLELAKDASEAGMDGIGIKDHTTCTTGSVYLLNNLFPHGPRFFSSLVLNPTVGSLNPSAVEAALQNGTDIIYFPTYGAKRQSSSVHKSTVIGVYPIPNNFEGISIMGSSELKAQTKEILQLISQYDSVLATGHISNEEAIKLLENGKKYGIKRMIATHVTGAQPFMTIEDQLKAISYGAFIEHSFLPVLKGDILLDEMGEQIRKVGVENIIISSDFGRVGIPKPVEGFGQYLEKMNQFGFSRDEIRIMVIENPKKLLTKIPSNYC